MMVSINKELKAAKAAKAAIDWLLTASATVSRRHWERLRGQKMSQSQIYQAAGPQIKFLMKHGAGSE
jgi:hypothetical protein